MNVLTLCLSVLPQRLIVEFAVEDVRIVKMRERKQLRSAARSRDSKKRSHDTGAKSHDARGDTTAATTSSHGTGKRSHDDSVKSHDKAKAPKGQRVRGKSGRSQGKKKEIQTQLPDRKVCSNTMFNKYMYVHL